MIHLIAKVEKYQSYSNILQVHPEKFIGVKLVLSGTASNTKGGLFKKSMNYNNFALMRENVVKGLVVFSEI